MPSIPSPSELDGYRIEKALHQIVDDMASAGHEASDDATFTPPCPTYIKGRPDLIATVCDLLREAGWWVNANALHLGGPLAISRVEQAWSWSLPAPAPAPPPTDTTFTINLDATQANAEIALLEQRITQLGQQMIGSGMASVFAGVAAQHPAIPPGYVKPCSVCGSTGHDASDHDL